MSRKQIEVNAGQEQRCPLDDPEARLTYKNTEGYLGLKASLSKG